MRKDKYIRVSTAMGVVLTGGCGECKLRKSGYCEGCRTQTILDLLDDVAKTGGVEIPQRHGRLIDADALHYSRVAIWHHYKTMPMGGYFGGMNAVVMSAEIHNAPTIIPADPEGGDA